MGFLRVFAAGAVIRDTFIPEVTAITSDYLLMDKGPVTLSSYGGIAIQLISKYSSAVITRAQCVLV